MAGSDLVGATAAGTDGRPGAAAGGRAAGGRAARSRAAGGRAARSRAAGGRAAGSRHAGDRAGVRSRHDRPGSWGAPDPVPARLDLADGGGAWPCHRPAHGAPRHGCTRRGPSECGRVACRSRLRASGAIVAVTQCSSRWVPMRLAYAFGVAQHVHVRGVTASGTTSWAAEINGGSRGTLPGRLYYFLTHQVISPTAQFPPLYPAFLAALDRGRAAGRRSAHQLVGAVVGVATVPSTSCCWARRVVGPALALAAAGVVPGDRAHARRRGQRRHGRDAGGPAADAGCAVAVPGSRVGAGARDGQPLGAPFGLVALTRSEGPVLFVGIVGVTLLALWRDGRGAQAARVCGWRFCPGGGRRDHAALDGAQLRLRWTRSSRPRPTAR